MHTKRFSQFLNIMMVIMMFFPLSFALAKTANDPNASQWAYTDIKLYDAWQYTTGSRNVVVAVIDNGFDIHHPDLKANVWKNSKEIANNNKDDDNNGYVDDVYGWNFLDNNNNPVPDVSDVTAAQKKEGVFHHGTVVAGLIGAVGNNALDGVGVNWQVRLMNIKVLGNNGSGSITPVAKAIDYAVDNGADIINISMVGQKTDDLSTAIERAYKKGVVVVAAAGNDMTDLNRSPLYPICADEGRIEQWVIGVSAIQKTHQIAQFSNSGSNCIDITAPGVQLGSTVLYSPVNGLSETFADGWNGTSFATPLVSGTAALIKSLHPNWGAKEITNAILTNTHKTPPQDEKEYANLFGKGLLQVDKVIAYASSQKTSPKIGNANTFSYISTYNPVTGETRKKNLTTDNISLSTLTALIDRDDVYTYTTKTDVLFSMVKTVNGKAEVQVYTSKWFPLASWAVAVPGKQELVLADMTGDETVEVVLASDIGEKTVFRLFSLQGKELGRYEHSKAHKGVSLAVEKGQGEEKDKLITLSHNGDQLMMQRFSGIGTLEQTSPIDYIQFRGTIAVGDIDGDNESELVVAAGKGEEPFLLYYELSGKIKRHFWAYDPSYRGGLDVIVGRYDDDENEDIVVSPLSGGVPVRVFSSKVRKVDEWWPFGENSPIGMKLLGEY